MSQHRKLYLKLHLLLGFLVILVFWPHGHGVWGRVGLLFIAIGMVANISATVDDLLIEAKNRATASKDTD